MTNSRKTYNTYEILGTFVNKLRLIIKIQKSQNKKKIYNSTL